MLSGAALVAVAVTLAACSSSGSSASSTTATTAAPAPTTTEGGSTGGATSGTTIVIKNFAFSPSTATVAPGATVTVTNNDQVAHTITATDGKFNTGDIPSGQSKTFTAPNAAGTYTYICSIHQYMTGTLTVS
jgi:plastocyanin